MSMSVVGFIAIINGVVWHETFSDTYERTSEIAANHVVQGDVFEIKLVSFRINISK